MISLFKKTSFRVSAVSLIIIVVIGGIMLANSNNNTPLDIDKIQANASVNTVPMDQIEESLQEDIVSSNIVENKQEKKQNPISTENKSKVDEDISQKKKNINNVASSNKNETEEDFSGIAVFWSTFRIAILNNNISQIKNMTQFPIETRGSMDSNPIIKFDQNKFQSVIKLYLNEISGQNYIDTNFDYIKESEKISFKNQVDYQNSKDYSKSAIVDGTWARIGNMEFKLINNNWNLTYIYLSEDSYKKLGIDINK